MEKFYVYELINLMGTIEYVGQTNDTIRRLREHKNINGKFYKRNDIFMNIVTSFDNRKDAKMLEEQLHKLYGLITDKEYKILAGLANGKINYGVNHYSSNLTDKDIQFIKENYKSYSRIWNTKTLSDKFNVSIGTISNIINNKTHSK